MFNCRNNIITTNDPETVFNALRLGNFAVNEGEQVINFYFFNIIILIYFFKNIM